jgi:hypothetical protein
MITDRVPLPFNVCLFLIFFQVLCLSKTNKINIRLYNTGEAIALKNLKAAFISKSLPAFTHVFIFY